MRSLKFLLITLVLSSAFIACKKDKHESPPQTQLEGKWVGKFGFGNAAPSDFYSFNIKPGGILEELGETGLKTGVGTWKLEGNIFTGSTTSVLGTGSKYSVIGAFDQSKLKLDGNWGFDESVTNGGLWHMTRQ